MFGRATIRLGIGPHSSFVEITCSYRQKRCDMILRTSWFFKKNPARLFHGDNQQVLDMTSNICD